MKVEVVYASKVKQYLREIDLPAGSTIQQAIEQSSLLTELPEICLHKDIVVGIFGKKCTLSTHLQPGDRIEIYRPLIIHPMQKRKRLAEIQQRTKKK